MEVLLNPHLLEAICQFQTGIFSDLAPLPFQAFDQEACFAYKSAPRLHYQRFVADIDAKFTPWLQEHSIRDMRRLVQCVSHLEIAIVAYAARYGKMDVLRCFQKSLHFHPFLLELASSSGHSDVVAYLMDQEYKTGTKFALDTAARHGHLDVVQLLHDRLAAPCTTDAFDWAAINGHLTTVKFLATQRTEGCTHWAFDMAAANGHLEVVRYLHSIGVPCTTHAMNHAARCGHLQVVRFLHENRLEGCTTSAMDWAAANGHLNVVEFLHFNRREGCSKRAMDDAASCGHLETVRFLHFYRSEGCTQYAMDHASGQGHMEVVRFLHMNRTEGCSSRAFFEAKQNGHKAVEEYLWSTGLWSWGLCLEMLFWRIKRTKSIDSNDDIIVDEKPEPSAKTMTSQPSSHQVASAQEL
ncbi:hypothetical protein AC1031_011746 [Aphanomyces cochlioides]|nr:hypothetical protein AC1031_011746 [Aphanomyces cochlioides]